MTVPSEILNDVISNQESIKFLLEEINLDKHTQALAKTISDKLAIMPQLDAKLTAIENSTTPRNVLNDVINNQENIKSLLKEINLDKHTKALAKTISDKLSIVPELDDKLAVIVNSTIPRNVLNDVINNQENIKSLLIEINLEKHTQVLAKTISDKLSIVPELDDKLAVIVNRTIPRNVLNDVINNQENIKSLLKEINLEKHTQVLAKTISDKLSIVPQLDGKLTAIENRTSDIVNDIISNQENIKILLKEINLNERTPVLKNTISDKFIVSQLDGILTAKESMTVPSEILNDVISNQESIKFLLEEINLDKHTQALAKTISDKLAIMPQLDAKLTAIENSTTPRNVLNDVINNQENIKSLLKEINLDKHTKALAKTISDKLSIVPELDDKLAVIVNSTIPRNVLNDVINNQENIKSLLIEINLEKHTQVLAKTISDKLSIVPELDDKLAVIVNRTIPRNVLNDVINNQENIKSLLKEINLEKHTQVLAKTISDKLSIVPQLDGKLTAIENRTSDIVNDIISNQENIKILLKEINLNERTPVLKNTISDKFIVSQLDGILTAKESMTVPSEILNDVISNQESIKFLLEEINLDKHTQALAKTISDKLAIVQQIDVKLSKIVSSTIPKTEHSKFYRDVHQYFHKIDANKICFKNDNQTLTCTNKSYPTSCADFDATICADNKCHIINILYGPKPFVVVCNNSVDDGGWMVIQRRINGSVDFYRNWAEYKHGFGDCDSEFFIGLDKLHALTSTLKPVELFIQLLDFENVTKFAKYGDFQVGNETENYKLIKLGSYTGDAGDSLSQHVGYNFSTKDRDNDISSRNCAEYYTAAWWYKQCYYSNLNGKYYQHPTKFYDASLHNRGINWNSFRGTEYSLKSVQMLIRPRKL